MKMVLCSRCTRERQHYANGLCRGCYQYLAKLKRVAQKKEQARKAEHGTATASP